MPFDFSTKNINQNERKSMNNQFDELTKSLAQLVTRRAALKKFGVGLAGMALSCFGLANVLQAADPTFATIDYPGERSTLALDINARADCRKIPDFRQREVPSFS